MRSIALMALVALGLLLSSFAGITQPTPSMAPDTTLPPIGRIAELFSKEQETREFWERESWSHELRADTLEYAVYHLRRILEIDSLSLQDGIDAVTALGAANKANAEALAACRDESAKKSLKIEKIKGRRNGWRWLAIGEAAGIGLGLWLILK